MALADLISRGRGTLLLSLAIEGLERGYTDANKTPVGISGPTSWRPYLSREGIVVADRIVPLDGRVEQQGITFRLADIDSAMTALLAAQRQATTTRLTATLAATETAAMTVEDTSRFAASGTLYLNLETLSYTGKTATTFTGLTRGVYGSRAVEHAVDAASLSYPVVSDRPLDLYGRRVILYASEVDDAGQVLDTPTTLYRGRCGLNVRLSADGAAWEIPTQPISSFLDQEFFGEPAVSRVRGIDLPFTGVQVAWVPIDGDATAIWISGTMRTADLAAGYRATLADLMADVRAAIAESGLSISLLLDDTGHVRLTARQAAGSTAKKSLRIVSTQGNVWPLLGWPPGWYDPEDLPAFPADYTSATIVHITAPRLPVTQALHVAEFSGGTTTVRVEDASSFRVGTLGNSYVRIDGGAKGHGFVSYPVEEPQPVLARLVSVDLSANTLTVEVRDNPFVPPPTYQLLLGSDDPSQSLRVTECLFIEDRADVVYTTHLLDSTLPPRIAPLVDSSDLDTASMALVGASLPASHTQRRLLVDGVQRLGELMAQELKVLGAVMCIRSGLIAWRILRPAPAGETGTATLDLSRIDAEGLPAYQYGSEGIVNLVKAKVAYDPRERAFKDEEIRVYDRDSIQRYRVTRSMDIEHPGLTLEGWRTRADFLRQVAARWFGLFGLAYPTVEVRCTFRGFGVECGDFVLLTHWALPDNTTGTRGLSNAGAAVIGRSLDYATGRGTLTLLLGRDVHSRIGRWAPAGRLTAWDNATRTATFGAPTDRYSGGGTKDLSRFTVGDRVEFRQMDSTSPTVISNVIESINLAADTAVMVSAMPGLPDPATNTIDMVFDD